MNDHDDPLANASRGSRGETKISYLYDFFLAHAGADKTVAEALFDLIAPSHRVFLDTKCLKLGDDWDVEISRAQRKSQITVVLISSKTEAAYYQREEIAAAINMARRETHRVVPLYLDGWPTDETGIPYGLRLKHGLSIPEVGGLQEVARKLKDLSAQLEAEGTAKTFSDLPASGETQNSSTEPAHHGTPSQGGSDPGVLERGKPDREDDLRPSIHIGHGVKGQNVVIGGTQVVHGDLTITVGAIAGASKSVREKLQEKIEQLSQVLGTLPENQSNYVHEVKVAVEDAIGEAAREPLDKKRLAVRAENLKRAAEALSSTSPAVFQLASQIATTLTRIGQEDNGIYQ